MQLPFPMKRTRVYPVIGRKLDVPKTCSAEFCTLKTIILYCIYGSGAHFHDPKHSTAKIIRLRLMAHSRVIPDQTLKSRLERAALEVRFTIFLSGGWSTLSFFDEIKETLVTMLRPNS